MFTFSSSLSCSYRRDLEALVFFNPRQHHVHAKIIEAMRRFGNPEIVGSGDQLCIQARGFEGLQSLFVFEDSGQKKPKLCGVVMYVRESADNLLVVHLAVHPAYSMSGKYSDKKLCFRIIEEVQSVARRIKGVKYLSILYLKGAVQRLPI